MARKLGSPRRWALVQEDCLQALSWLAAESVDVVVTDPPYGINMAAWDTPRALERGRGRKRGKASDPAAAYQRFCAEWTAACLRVLKPGAYLASFASPRYAHLLARALEEAGFELRDVLMWVHSQGYPATQIPPPSHIGWGTGLKPAYEPILLARKPTEGTLAQNLARHGTGALHIDACRIQDPTQRCEGEGRSHARGRSASAKGRWPANLLLAHGARCTERGCEGDCAVRLLGEPARFFYCAKANRREREAGCERLPRGTTQTFQVGERAERRANERPVANIHPTVKPIELMRWLVRLTTPADGLLLDPFAGSGSTGVAAVLEGARFLGIERERAYVPIARARIGYWASRRRGAERGGASGPRARTKKQR